VLDGGGGFYWAVGSSGAGTPLPGDDIYAVAFAPTGHGLAVTRQRAVTFLPSVAPGEAVAAPGPEPATLFENPPEAPAAELTYTFSASWAPAVAFVPGAELAAVASNSFIEFVNPVRRAKPTRVKTGSRTVLALAAAPNGKALYAGGKPGAVEVYDTSTRAKRTVYDFELGGVHALACSPDGLTFAAAGDTGLVVCDVDE
jgi:hypothetical protein